ncbi:hypothetical protein [Flavihumibacter fluvii]|uniref:hypothetical protein n=1 Tax=Flavihumibacter fluvii TaxID=2838157 RepID=UPI001BDEA9AA|nr:hypothetical protein [Flavihumibacter fluvii]ULQ54733.1 hypothetical protein KJS93_10425 [Flavihumibacter fluvii]
MKNSLILIAGMLCVNISIIAQQQNDKNSLAAASFSYSFQASMNLGNFSDSSTLKAEYLQKSKSQKTVGWVLLGTGVAVGIAGVIVFNQSDWLFEGDSQTDTGGILFLVGTCTALGSIPLFISSRNNAKKAAAISFKNQELYLPKGSNFLVKSQPAVSLKIKL